MCLENRKLCCVGLRVFTSPSCRPTYIYYKFSSLHFKSKLLAIIYWSHFPKIFAERAQVYRTQYCISFSFMFQSFCLGNSVNFSHNYLDFRTYIVHIIMYFTTYLILY